MKKSNGKLKRQPLTKVQHKVMETIKHFIKMHGYPPSNNDLCFLCEMWPSGVDQHLRLIEKKGYLKRTPNTARGLVVL